MNIASGTDKGTKRDNNQDSYTSFNINDVTCLIIADGMGGHKAGSTASSSACSIVAENVKRIAALEQICDENAGEILTSAISNANKTIYAKQLNDESLKGMGTTVVAAIITKNKIHVCNVGDSRAYVVGDGIKQITKDHSYVQDLIDNGVITKEEGNNHPNKNIITRAVGTEDTVQTDYFIIQRNDASKLIICTDGLTNMVSDSEILDILKVNDAQNSLKLLIEEANKNGGVDNITVIIVDFEEVNEL